MNDDKGTENVAALKWETRGPVAILTLNRPKGDELVRHGADGGT